MPAVETQYVEQTIRQTHTGDTIFTDVPGAERPAAFWTPLAVYMLIVNARVCGDDATALYSWRMVHGAAPTVFPGSLKTIEPMAPEVGARGYDYFWITKYTAPAITEDVKLQFRPENAGDTVTVNTITITAIRLDADLTEGKDWAYGEDNDTGAPVQHTTTFESFASTGAFTPDNVDDDWLVIACANYLINDITISANYRIERDSETDTQPSFLEEGSNTAESKVYGLARVYTLAASPHTFTVQGRDDEAGIQNDHQYTAIFALRLNVFEDHGFVYIEAENTIAPALVHVEMAGVEITPTQTGDFIVVGYVSLEHNSANRGGNMRCQVDGTTIPTGRDATFFGADTQTYDARDENPLISTFRTNFGSTDLKDVDMDGSVATTAGTPTQEDRSLAVFSLELAAGPPPPVAGGTVGVTSRVGRTVLLAAQRDDPDGNPTDEYLFLRLDEFGQLQTTSEGVAEMVMDRTGGMTLRASGNVVLLAAQRDDPDGNPTDEYVLLRVDQFGRLRTTSEAAGTGVSGRTKGMTHRVTGNVVLGVGQRDDPGGTPTAEYLALRTDQFGRLRILPEV